MKQAGLLRLIGLTFCTAHSLNIIPVNLDITQISPNKASSGYSSCLRLTLALDEGDGDMIQLKTFSNLYCTLYLHFTPLLQSAVSVKFYTDQYFLIHHGGRYPASRVSFDLPRQIGNRRRRCSQGRWYIDIKLGFN